MDVTLLNRLLIGGRQIGMWTIYLNERYRAAGAVMSKAYRQRELSPEFTAEYQMQQHYKRLREIRVAPNRRHHTAGQRNLNLRAVKRIQIIQMADLPRYHYEVWANYDNGPSELLRTSYVHGLKTALQMALEKWGGGHRIVLERWHPKKRKPLLVISSGDIYELQSG